MHIIAALLRLRALDRDNDRRDVPRLVLPPQQEHRSPSLHEIDGRLRRRALVGCQRRASTTHPSSRTSGSSSRNRSRRSAARLIGSGAAPTRRRPSQRAASGRRFNKRRAQPKALRLQDPSQQQGQQIRARPTRHRPVDGGLLSADTQAGARRHSIDQNSWLSGERRVDLDIGRPDLRVATIASCGSETC